MENRVFQCLDCNHQWEVEPCTEGGKHGYEIPCPKCGGSQKAKLSKDGGRHVCGSGHAHEHGQGGCCGGH